MSSSRRTREGYLKKKNRGKIIKNFNIKAKRRDAFLLYTFVFFKFCLVIFNAFSQKIELIIFFFDFAFSFVDHAQCYPN